MPLTLRQATADLGLKDPRAGKRLLETWLTHHVPKEEHRQFMWRCGRSVRVADSVPDRYRQTYGVQLPARQRNREPVALPQSATEALARLKTPR
jgi:hypothetical protein